MPFDPDNPPEKVSKLSEKKQRQWVHVFNSCYDKHGDDALCHKMAWGAVKKSGSTKLGTRRNIEDAVFKAIEDETSTGMAKVIFNWVIQGIRAGNNYFIGEIRNIRFNYVDNDNMTFTAKVLVVFPERDKKAWKTYRWKMKGKKYKGVISSVDWDEMNRRQQKRRDPERIGSDVEAARGLFMAFADIEAANRIGMGLLDEVKVKKLKSRVVNFLHTLGDFRKEMASLIDDLTNAVNNKQSLREFPELRDILALGNAMRQVRLSPRDVESRIVKVVTVDATS